MVLWVASDFTSPHRPCKGLKQDQVLYATYLGQVIESV